MTRPRLAALAIATMCIIAGGASCHDLIYDRDPNFCCLDESHCAAGGAPEGMTFPCTRPGDVCDVDRNACIPDPSIVDCDNSDDCVAADPSRPACVDGQCVACGDEVHFCPATEPVCSASYVCEACIDETSCSPFADTPFCSGSGECVACRPGNDIDCGSPTAPICDQEAESCRACRSGECPSGVCDTGAGACVADADIIFVAVNGSDAATCTRTAPCRSIQRGINVAGGRQWMSVGTGAYDTFTINGATLTILAAPGAHVTRGTVGPVVDITGAAVVTIEGLRIHDGPGSTGDGVRCSEGADNPRLTLRRTTVQSNAGVGVKATGCDVTIERSSIKANIGGGITISGRTASITNNMIAANGVTGGIDSLVGGVKLDAVSAVTFEFNTVGGNGTNDAFAAGVQCSAGSPVTLANNILHGGQSNQVPTSTPNCSFAFNLSNQSLGGSNITTTENSAGLFVDPTMGDFHSRPTSPAMGAADPAATVAVDFDGDARPAPAGSQRDIGADEVSQ